MTLYALAFFLLGRRAVAAFAVGLLAGALLASASTSALSSAREATDGAEVRAAVHALGLALTEDRAAGVAVAEAETAPTRLPPPPSGGPRTAPAISTPEDSPPASATPRDDPGAAAPWLHEHQCFGCDDAILVGKGESCSGKRKDHKVRRWIA